MFCQGRRRCRGCEKAASRASTARERLEGEQAEGRTLCSATGAHPCWGLRGPLMESGHAGCQWRDPHAGGHPATPTILPILPKLCNEEQHAACM